MLVEVSELLLAAGSSSEVVAVDGLDGPAEDTVLNVVRLIVTVTVV